MKKMILAVALLLTGIVSAQADGSDEVFQYIVCAICPVKDGKMELGFFPGENEFHSCAQIGRASCRERV